MIAVLVELAVFDMNRREKPNAKLGKITQVDEGVALRYHRRKDGSVVMHTICCDCCLVHLEQYIVNKNYISVKVWRVDNATRKLRTKFKRQVLRDQS